MKSEVPNEDTNSDVDVETAKSVTMLNQSKKRKKIRRIEGILRVILIKEAYLSLNLHGFSINHVVVSRLAQALDYFYSS